MTQAFHFSPRPNRAGEIRWSEWSPEAFERSRLENKPILLAISAVWCHWCHVMDETTYSNPEIIELINDRFVPVRVDNDRRPDINARYNQGGWPTTVFLTPDGVMLTGATYVPPAQMAHMLPQIDRYFNDHRADIEKRAAEVRARNVTGSEDSATDLAESTIERIAGEIANRYDEQYGGFGDEPKFPMTDALEFLLFEFGCCGDQRSYEMVARSILGMSTGGMYDHVEGGFFRYSTTRDWSVPHFEKMTEDHAGLLRVLAGLYARSKNPEFRATLVSAERFVRTVLYDPATHRFAGSQDADEAYFALPLKERSERAAPYVDRTSYSNWTASIAGALFAVAYALDDDGLTAEMCAALDELHDVMLDGRGLLFHFIEPHGKPQVRGLLCDQAAYLRALIDAHEFSGEPRFLERAVALSSAIAETFGSPDGGFYDRAPLEGELGALALRDQPLGDNALVADSLLRLSVLCEEPSFRITAQRTLARYAKSCAGAGPFAATFARALRRYLGAERTIAIVGTAEDAAGLREAAHALGDPLAAIRSINPGDAATLAARGLQPAPSPAAYVCRGRACGPPASSPADLVRTYETLARLSGT